MTGAASAAPGNGAGALYVVWGAIGLSIVLEFGLLLLLQRRGVVEISNRGGVLPVEIHLALFVALFAAVAVAVMVLRSRSRRWSEAALSEPTAGEPSGRARRAAGAAVAAWALAEALALIGFAFALALQPVPRLALTGYFTGALLLWLLSRPSAPRSNATAPRSAGRPPPRT